MTAQIIDGALLAQKIKLEIKNKVLEFTSRGRRAPGLGVLLIGEDPASQVYVSAKNKIAKEIGFENFNHHLDSSCSLAQAKQKLLELANNEKVDGILLQLPLPKHLPTLELLELIPANKDVDGLTCYSQGALAKRLPALYPCTPLGIMELLKSVSFQFSGAMVGVIGRSVLVGAAVTRMIEHSGATTISINSQTKNPHELTKLCDCIIVAAGKMHLVDASWLKPGVVVIDVGIHRENNKLYGDVNFESVKNIASAITPVPGGVGPMTIAMLMQNCLKSYIKSSN